MSLLALMQPTPVTPVQAAEKVACADTAAALDLGLSAYVANDYVKGRSQFECIIASGREEHRLYALFYLARIFADNNGTETNHARAYAVYSTIADEYGRTVDPEDPRRAPFAARALTAVGTYVLNGNPDAGVRPNSAKAADILRYAANFFDEPHAQFEIAKMMLVGDGLKEDPEFALHYLQHLSKRGHAGAQAFLADLLARGKYVKKDTTTALALVRLATKYAQPSDRLWVEDIYQHIYCGSSAGVRSEANGLVARWSKELTSVPPKANPRNPTPDLEPDRRLTPERTCSNGEVVDLTPTSGSNRTSVTRIIEAEKPDTSSDQRTVGVQTLVPGHR